MLFNDLFDIASPERRFLAPEVVQTSAMDCGPATLKCLLKGFGISVSYGRLREACQTDVDGTSIDTLEEIALQLGLESEQIMVPADHLLLPETQALPAIVIVTLPNGLTHFVVLWRLHGRFVQLMDPGTGRRWLTQKRFQRDLYIHTHPVPQEFWREWAGTEGFTAPLFHRLSTMKLNTSAIAPLIASALDDPGWQGAAALDSTTRMVDALVRADGLNPGQEAGRVLERFFRKVLESPEKAEEIVPAHYWSVRPNPDDPAGILLRGAVLVRVIGRYTPEQEPVLSEIPEDEKREPEEQRDLSPELLAALEEPELKPEHEVLQALRIDGLFTPTVVLIAIALATIGVTIEAMLLKGIMEIGPQLEVFEQRIGAVQGVFLFFFAMFLLEVPMSATVTRIGRRLETRLRVTFLEKIPRLGDRYFHSRLTSDMTQRAYELRQLRSLPGLGISFFRILVEIILTAAGLIWLTPFSAPIAITATIVNVGISFVTQPLLREQDLRLRTFIGALSRFYLDALLGLMPIRTHGADRSVRHEHESMLVEWVRASLALFRIDVLITLAEMLLGVGFGIWLLFSYLAQQGEASGVLLLIYWTLKLPNLGRSLADVAQSYPMQRNRLLRLLEPLTAPDESEMWKGQPEDEDAEARPESEMSFEEKSPGATLGFQDVNVQTGGHTILTDITFHLESGEHIAVVGPSGAGKSSLVGLLLGWHRPAAGSVHVDGKPLKGERLYLMRKETAWVDPSIQIWNRSLYDNLYYGSPQSTSSVLETVIQQAELLELLEKLPRGAQTPLGEGGGLVSGGEGQRVRLGRAMLRPGVRLVILDEPFRGLDREKRRKLLQRARQYWHAATLIFISHDISDALTFERVVVIENGRIAEDENPNVLMQQEQSRYRMLLESEEAVRHGLWESADWRRLWLENGCLEER